MQETAQPVAPARGEESEPQGSAWCSSRYQPALPTERRERPSRGASQPSRAFRPAGSSRPVLSAKVLAEWRSEAEGERDEERGLRGQRRLQVAGHRCLLVVVATGWSLSSSRRVHLLVS